MDSFGINPDSLTTHFLCSGATGTGKTTIANRIIIGLDKMNKKSICIDVKRDTRHLIRQIPFLIIKLPNPFLKWNILNPPPGVQRRAWHMSVIRQFVETTFLAEAVESYLQESLDWLSKKNENVNFYELYNFIKSRKATSLRERNWLASAQNRLGALISTFSNMLNTRERFPLQELTAQYNICFEIDQAGQFGSFFASLIPSYLFIYRLVNNLRGNELKNAIFFDEAIVVVGKTIVKRHSLMADPALLSLIRLGREFGLGCLFFTNHPSAIDDTVKAQSGIKILMRLGHYPDIFDIGKSMGLTKEQMDCIIDAPAGVGIVKKFGVSPFLCQFENSVFEKNVTDKEIEENNKALLKGTEFEKYFEKASTAKANIPNRESVRVKDSNYSIKPKMKSFLTNIVNFPFQCNSERYKNLGLSAGKGNNLAKNSVRYDLCKDEKINHGYRGGVKSFLVITEKGYEVLGIPPLKFSRGTTFVHWYWQNTIATKLNSFENTKAKIEGNMKGKNIDILAEVKINDEITRIGIEISITSGKEQEKKNIIEDIDAGVDFVICACQKEKKDKINEMITSLETTYKEKTKQLLLPQLLKIHNSEELIEILKQKEESW